MKKQSWMSFFITLSFAFILIALLVPLVIKDRTKKKILKKTLPSKDNIKLWGKFPGELSTTLTHNFKFFDYSNYNNLKDEIKLSENIISLNEKIDYDIINYDEEKNEINFNSKKIYNIKEESKVKNIKSISMGLFELLETLSNKNFYQKGIYGIKYLLDKTFGNSLLFNKKLYCVNSHQKLISDEKKFFDNVFNKIESEETKNKLFSHEKYGFKYLTGFYQWINLLNKENIIDNIIWIKEEFALNDNEINSLLNKESFLYKNFTEFNNQLIDIFKCEKDCEKKLIYYQLINRNITKYFNIENIKELNKLLDKDFEIEFSPEMDLYFNNNYNINKDKGNYNDSSLSENQLNLLFNSNSSLLNPSNIISLFNIFLTNDNKKGEEIFTLKENQIKFISNYIFYFLPSLFLNIKFKQDNKEFSLNENSRIFTSFLQILVDNTFGKLIKNNNLISILRSLIIWEKIKNKLSDNICEEIFQKTLDDGKRVLKICSNKNFNFSSIEVVNKWIKPFKCTLNEKYEECDMTVFNELNKIVYFSKNDLKKLYSNDTLGKYIYETNDIINKHYNCKDDCTDYYLAKLQYTTCNVTNNPPEIIKDKKSESIKNWDPENFDKEVELKFYQKNCSVDCNEKSNNIILSLYNTTKNILECENSDSYNNRILIEKAYTLYLNNIFNSDYGKNMNVSDSKIFFDTFKNMISNEVFNSELLVNYSNSENIIFGNDKEDKKYIEFLSNGDFIDGFKPNKKKTTGFNFYFNTSDLNNSDNKLNYDDLLIETKKDENNKDQILRRIIKMNNSTFLNVKKEEYDLTTNNYIEINCPLYNNFDITKEKIWLSDGFQFDSSYEKIYYYDELSSRILEFNYDESNNYKDEIECYKYILNKNISLNLNEINEVNFDLNENFGFVTQKFNKPFVISDSENEKIKNKINDNNLDKNNYICVDPLSNMVIESNINLIYSIYTKNFGNLFSNINNNDLFPIIYYNRKYDIDVTSYQNYFTENKSYKNKKLFVLIFALIVAFIFCSLAVFFYFQKESERVDSVSKNIDTVLVPDKFDA